MVTNLDEIVWTIRPISKRLKNEFVGLCRTLGHTVPEVLGPMMKERIRLENEKKRYQTLNSRP